jgi:hypothetical protein
MNIFTRIYKDYQIKKYIELGKTLGDAMSYSYMGQIHKFDSLVKRFQEQESKIIEYGIKPYTLDEFIDFGGYGISLPQIEKGYPEIKKEIQKYNKEMIKVSQKIQQKGIL